MVKISDTLINTTAPYKVKPDKREGFVQFVTDHDVKYMVGFKPFNEILSFIPYEFIIANVNNKKSPRDRKLRDTVIAILTSFFEMNDETVLYMCETGDNKQDMRQRLFSSWYESYGLRNKYTYLHSCIIDDEGICNYVALIVRNDNPNFANIIKEFADTIEFFRNKPE